MLRCDFWDFLGFIYIFLLCCVYNEDMFSVIFWIEIFCKYLYYNGFCLVRYDFFGYEYNFWKYILYLGFNFVFFLDKNKIEKNIK